MPELVAHLKFLIKIINYPSISLTRTSVELDYACAQNTGHAEKQAERALLLPCSNRDCPVLFLLRSLAFVPALFLTGIAWFSFY